jgi:hypothetical protein
MIYRTEAACCRTLCRVRSMMSSHRSLQLRAHDLIGLTKARSMIWSHFFSIFAVNSLFAGKERVDRVHSSVCSADGRTTCRANKVARNMFDRIERAPMAPMAAISPATRAKVMTIVECSVKNDVRVFERCACCSMSSCSHCCVFVSLSLILRIWPRCADNQKKRSMVDTTTCSTT